MQRLFHGQFSRTRPVILAVINELSPLLDGDLRIWILLVTSVFLFAHQQVAWSAKLINFGDSVSYGALCAVRSIN